MLDLITDPVIEALRVVAVDPLYWFRPRPVVLPRDIWEQFAVPMVERGSGPIRAHLPQGKCPGGPTHQMAVLLPGRSPGFATSFRRRAPSKESGGAGGAEGTGRGPAIP